jgi:hypothetical protein
LEQISKEIHLNLIVNNVLTEAKDKRKVSLVVRFDVLGMEGSLLLLLALGDRGLLVLLVLGDKIVHVALGLSELHLVHTLTSVPMQESLTTEHGRELVTDTLEELLDGGGVSDEGGRHLEATGGNGAESGLNVVGDPLNEVALVLVLDVAHLVLNLLHGDLTAEESGAGEVTAVTEVGSSHHVLGVEHLLGQLRNADLAVLAAATAGQGSEADHEEVQTGEGNHVDGELAEIGVELTGETEGGGHTGHDGGDEVVEVTVRGLGELEGTHANIVQSLRIVSIFPCSNFTSNHTSLSIQKVSSECSTSW